MLATDWLVRQPWVDTSRLELVGVSLGTPFAAATGALDTRFRRVWLIHGGADNQAWLTQNLAREIDPPWLRSGVASLLLAIVDGGDFDTAERAASIAPRPLVVIGARNDERLEPANVEALYEAALEPKMLIWTDTPHIEPDRPEVVHELLELVLGRVAES
jgi:dienelactone hydrolase